MLLTSSWGLRSRMSRAVMRIGGAPVAICKAGVSSYLVMPYQKREMSLAVGSISAYAKTYEASMKDPVAFWEKASQDIYWKTPSDKILDTSNPPFYRWFPNGTTNMCYNAIDRHVLAGRGDQTAIIYDSPLTGTLKKISYAELLEQVKVMAALYRKNGVKKGDRILIYMPMVPEGVVAMLASARIGAVHSVVFGGFAAPELAIRIDDAEPVLMVTASCGIEVGRIVEYKPIVDKALAISHHKIKNVLLLNRPQCKLDTVDNGQTIAGGEGYKELASEIKKASATLSREELDTTPEWVESCHPLYVLYTSGTTGKPKGVVRDTGGHAVALNWSMRWVYNTLPGEVWWGASDLGWTVGHSYLVYGPLLGGCSTVLFEGKPVGTPDASTYWRVLSQHKVRGFFTAPTALRAIKREDPDGTLAQNYDLTNLDAMWVAGERCDPDTLNWATMTIGRPVCDHMWATETGWPMLAHHRAYGKALPVRPGSAGVPVPGWAVQVLDPSDPIIQSQECFSAFQVAPDSDSADPETVAPLAIHRPRPGDDGAANSEHEHIHPAPVIKRAEPNRLGPLCVRLPMPPGTMTTLWKNEERFISSYTAALPGYLIVGDAAFQDAQGYVHVMSRIDDVINVAGHRLATGDLESVVSAHPAVAECAVVGAADEVRGQVPIALVVLKANAGKTMAEVINEVVEMVRKDVGAFAYLRKVGVVPRLPKTRSGKVLRNVLRRLADGVALEKAGAPPTIEDPAALSECLGVLRKIGYGHIHHHPH